MGRGQYELIQAPTDELGGKSGPKAVFTARFIGKWDEPNRPYNVANETIAALIGTALGLPVAPGITDEIGGKPYFLSQDLPKPGDKQVGPQGGAAAVEKLVADNRLLVHGAIIFDLYIANNDRGFLPERRNLAVNNDGSLFLYDQGNCCFYRNRKTAKDVAGVPRLKSVEKSLSAMFDKGGDNFYWQLLTDVKLADHWFDRIRQIPDFMLESFVNMIPRAVNPPTEAERQALIEFLKKRRHYLRDQVLNDKTHFPKLGG